MLRCPQQQPQQRRLSDRLCYLTQSTDFCLRPRFLWLITSSSFGKMNERLDKVYRLTQCRDRSFQRQVFPGNLTLGLLVSTKGTRTINVQRSVRHRRLSTASALLQYTRYRPSISNHSVLWPRATTSHSSKHFIEIRSNCNSLSSRHVRRLQADTSSVILRLST